MRHDPQVAADKDFRIWLFVLRLSLICLVLWASILLYIRWEDLWRDPVADIPHISPQADYRLVPPSERPREAAGEDGEEIYEDLLQDLEGLADAPASPASPGSSARAAEAVPDSRASAGPEPIQPIPSSRVPQPVAEPFQPLLPASGVPVEDAEPVSAVPAPDGAPVPPSEAPASVSALVGTAFVQLGSYRTRPSAEQARRVLVKAHAALLSELDWQVATARLEDVPYYRLLFGPLPEAQAKELCATLEGRNAACLVKREATASDLPLAEPDASRNQAVE